MLQSSESDRYDRTYETYQNITAWKKFSNTAKFVQMIVW